MLIVLKPKFSDILARIALALFLLAAIFALLTGR